MKLEAQMKRKLFSPQRRRGHRDYFLFAFPQERQKPISPAGLKRFLYESICRCRFLSDFSAIFAVKQRKKQE
jgi:hypothetical protein